MIRLAFLDPVGCFFFVFLHVHHRLMDSSPLSSFRLKNTFEARFFPIACRASYKLGPCGRIDSSFPPLVPGSSFFSHRGSPEEIPSFLYNCPPAVAKPRLVHHVDTEDRPSPRFRWAIRSVFPPHNSQFLLSPPVSFGPVIDFPSPCPPSPTISPRRLEPFRIDRDPFFHPCSQF